MGTPKSGDLLLGTSVPTPNTDEIEKDDTLNLTNTTNNEGDDPVVTILAKDFLQSRTRRQ